MDINEASVWVHALVIVIKPNGKLCVCLDPRTLNSVLWYNIHNAKRFVDIISKVQGFKYVSKIDADSGFWTLPLDPSSQLLTTFDTLWGRFCFMKLPFGLCESQYFFQYYIDLNFESLTNAHIIANYVLIVGSDLGPLDEHDHDRCLLQVLNWCREVGLKLNAAKCIFKAKQVVFYGHLVYTNGLSPDPRKVQAISNMPVPSNKTELQSYIGMCNFLSYVPYLTDRLYVLRRLMAKDSDFIWTVSHTKAFECSKDNILSCATLMYYDDEKPCAIQVNASNIGVGAMLIQEDKVIEYHSHALTSTQQCYSNIEREACALVNVVEHFHHYVFGKPFEVHTDHQSLVQLSVKPLVELSPRLQCLFLRVNQYKYAVKYVRQTRVMIADCLSHTVCQDAAETMRLKTYM